MALLGQASGGFTESSSALRILYVGVRNSIGVLTDDAFTQNNPPAITTAGTISTSPGSLVNTLGVLSGSVAFTRPDIATGNSVGGPAYGGSGAGLAAAGTLTDAEAAGVKPVGCFINNAAGNAFENTPGAASGKGPYVSAQGTFGNSLFETQALAAGATLVQGDALTYQAGQELISSVNGYLMPSFDGGGDVLSTVAQFAYAPTQATCAGAAPTAAHATPTVIGVLKMAPDAVMNELVYDQRI